VSTTPTPTEWDARYREGNTPWDLGSHSALVQRLASARLKTSVDILVPGCGLAHDVEALATKGHRVMGLDIAPTAVTQASERLERLGLTNASVSLGDFLTPAPRYEGSFDALIEHTCYCALEPQQWGTYVQSAWRVLKPGGLLLGSFLAFDGGGPPFGTSPEALRLQFERAFEILHLKLTDERFTPKDVPQMEAVFQRRPSL